MPHKDKIEDLLKIVESSESGNDIFQDPFKIKSFLSYYQLGPGQNVIPNVSLFSLYIRWSKNQIRFNSFKDLIRTELPVDFKSGGLLINKTSEEMKNYLIPKTTGVNKNSLKKSQNFKTFIYENQIESGNFFIESFVLHHWYEDWRTNKKVTNYSSLTLQQFILNCELFFEKKTIKNNIYFGISKNTKKYLTIHRLQAIRRRQKEHSEKKTIKKK